MLCLPGSQRCIPCFVWVHLFLCAVRVKHVECAAAVMLSRLSCPQSVQPRACSAVAYERDNVADELLSQGADLQAQDSQGNTVLHYAAGRRRRGRRVGDC